jgi:hypothetical protein
LEKTLKNQPRPRSPSSSAIKIEPSYDTISAGLMCALILLPIPMIFLVVRGNYSPRQKLYWSLAAAIETIASSVMTLYTLYSLRGALAVL